MGRVLFDPVEGADGYVVYLSQDHVLSTALRHEVGALTDIELVNFGLSPGEWFVWVASLAGGRESVKAGPESFVWRNALVSP